MVEADINATSVVQERRLPTAVFGYSVKVFSFSLDMLAYIKHCSRHLLRMFRAKKEFTKDYCIS